MIIIPNGVIEAVVVKSWFYILYYIHYQHVTSLKDSSLLSGGVQGSDKPEAFNDVNERTRWLVRMFF
jgi:hypothetical protein